MGFLFLFSNISKVLRSAMAVKKSLYINFSTFHRRVIFPGWCGDDKILAAEFEGQKVRDRKRGRERCYQCLVAKTLVFFSLSLYFKSIFGCIT